MDDHQRHQRFVELSRKFAAGRITVMRRCAGPEMGFSPRYFPRLAGQNIRPMQMPKDGYLSADDAKRGAEQYRDDCRAAVSKEKA